MEKNPYIVPGILVAKEEITAKKLFKAIEIKLGITSEQMKNLNRKREIVEARHIFSSLMTKHTKLSLEAIGNYVNRDHSTVIHSRNTIENLLPLERNLRRKYKEIEEFALFTGTVSQPIFSNITIGQTYL